MHFRRKELSKRSAFDGKELGKNQIDVFTKDLVFADRPSIKGNESMTLGDMVFQMFAP